MRINSPTEVDVERWAEMLDTPDVINYSSFSKEWDKYFDEEINLGKRIKRKDNLKSRTFTALLKLRPDIAGEVIVTRKEPAKVRIKELKYVSSVKGRIVRAERTFVTVKGKRVIRYRDRYGRFASIKKGKK